MISKMGIPSDKYQEKIKHVLDGASISSLLGRFQVFIIWAFSHFLKKTSQADDIYWPLGMPNA